jgi:membrane fusion protein, multidrug efflux system
MSEFRVGAFLTGDHIANVRRTSNVSWSAFMNRRWIASVLLVGVVVGTGSALAAWKHSALEAADAVAASQPEPAEAVAVAVAREREHSPSTTSIGTIVALRSITVRNELPGTVRHVSLVPGQIVAAGTVLVALDVSVEQADLQALRAQAALAETQFARMQRMVQQRAASEMEVDTARAERDVALAQIARTQAVIDRKTIRAPFKARVGISDVHPGQYLNEGALLTTLQGVDDHAYVDFTVSQQVATRLRAGDTVSVAPNAGAAITSASIVALDSRVDPATRNATVRAKLADESRVFTPGSSVRVQVPVGDARVAVAVPASAVRKGPDGDHVFVLVADEAGALRARVRQVRLDIVAGDEALIESGLSAGEKVAASGSFKLRDAALVAVIDAPQSVALNQ